MSTNDDEIFRKALVDATEAVRRFNEGMTAISKLADLYRVEYAKFMDRLKKQGED